MIYLDYAATTPVRPEVIQAMTEALTEAWGNPSSNHLAGHTARKGMDRARRQVAELVGATPESVIFTSGGTEADNLAIRGVAHALKAKGRHLVISNIEHSAVRVTCKMLADEGFETTEVPVGPNGVLDPEAVAQALRPDTILVSVMHVNNEIGTIQPIAEIAERAHARGILVHTDAVQSAGKIPVSMEALGVDLLAISAHKIYGPKGVGALIRRQGVPLAPVLTGGGHERGFRAGTENVPGIVGFGVAAELAVRELSARMQHDAELGRFLEEALLEAIPGSRVNGDPQRRWAGCVSLRVPGVDGADLLAKLDEAGVAISAGSACKAFKQETSHVIAALNLPNAEDSGTLRMTVGAPTTREEIQVAVGILAETIEGLRGKVAR
jgi:cysteine desulfurase